MPLNATNNSGEMTEPIAPLNLALGVLTPSALSGGVNNYAPTGWDEGVTILRIDCGGAARSITGLSATRHGHLVLLVNSSDADGEDITLVHESTSSTAANRFGGANNTDVVVRGGANGGSGAVFVYYDAIHQRWRVVAI